jgi:chemosensory pili system protein ChpA (sensor histidine kinase/response regulator)
MNRWLASERDGTPELFDLLDGARTLFAGWVDQLANGDTRSPTTHGCSRPATQSRFRDTESAVTDGPPEEPAAVLPDSEPEGSSPPRRRYRSSTLTSIWTCSPTVPGVTELVATDLPIDATAGQDIDLELDFDLDEPGAELEDEQGAIDLTSEIDAEERALDAGGDRTLFDLFIAEARGHVATLRRELTRLHINPSLRPSQDSMLAAHTLGGISLTVDQGEISALAKALEHALNRCDARGEPPEADQSALLNNAASALEAQVAAIGDGTAAAPAPDLIAQLDRLFETMPAVRTDGASGARTSGDTVRPAFRAGCRGRGDRTGMARRGIARGGCRARRPWIFRERCSREQGRRTRSARRSSARHWLTQDEDDLEPA